MVWGRHTRVITTHAKENVTSYVKLTINRSRMICFLLSRSGHKTLCLCMYVLDSTDLVSLGSARNNLKKNFFFSKAHFMWWLLEKKNNFIYLNPILFVERALIMNSNACCITNTIDIVSLYINSKTSPQWEWENTSPPPLSSRLRKVVN